MHVHSSMLSASCSQMPSEGLHLMCIAAVRSCPRPGDTLARVQPCYRVLGGINLTGVTRMLVGLDVCVDSASSTGMKDG
jgi:hypothetical protein